MKRRKVVLTIEVETVLAIRELRKLKRLFFEPDDMGSRYLDRDPQAERACSSMGTITQVQVNVIK